MSQDTQGGSELQLAEIAEKARVSENRYKALFLASRDAIMTLEPPSWKFTSGNPATLEMFKVKSEEEFLANEPWRLSPELQPDGRASKEKAAEMIEKAMRDGYNFFEWTHRRANGEDFPVEVLLSRVENSGKPFLHAVVRDITERKKTEERLKDYEEGKFKAVFDNANDGMALVDAATQKFSLGNRAFCAMLGYGAKEINDLAIADIHPAEDLAHVLEQFEKQLKGELTIAEGLPVKRKDGSVFYADINASPVMIGEKKFVLGIFRDITERKKKEEQLHQTQLIVENSHDAIIGETLDGIITSWNGGAANMFGYTDFEIIGKPVSILFPPEIRDEVPALMDRIKAGEVIADRDSVRLRKDGSKIDIAFTASAIKTKDGTVVGASCIERDVTERKKAEEAMRQIQLIVENSHDAIIGETLDGIITSWNGGAATMFGYAKEEMIGISMANLFSPELKDEFTQLLEKVKHGEIVADYDSIWLRKDRTRADVEFSLSPIKADVEFSIAPVKGEDGAIVGASLVGRDITERKKSEQQIKELNEVRSKFISIISHQLRTPLTAVNWNLEAILDGDFGKLEDITRKFLLVTHRSSVEITNRIHDLLTAMDIEEGRVVFEREDVSIDSIVAAVISEMHKKCEMKNIICEYDAPKEDLPAIEGDGEKIRTAITKLVENAIIYTKENGNIAAKLERHGNAIRFEVKDTGVGIPAPEQHRVFTRFFRASNASVMQPDAFGLGLFIAKSFVEQHGGTIGFESKEGEGSTFWFEIPISSTR